MGNAAFTDKCLVVDSNKGANGQMLQLWSCDGSEQFKLWDLYVPGRRAAETSSAKSEEPCLQVLCSTGSVLVGADSRGCGGRCEELQTDSQAVQSPPSELRWYHDLKFCMSVDDNTFQNGQKMQLWECS